MKDYLENVFEAYKVVVKELDLNKEQLIQYTFETFKQIIRTADLEEMNKENFLNDLLDLVSMILSDRESVKRLYKNDYKTLTADEIVDQYFNLKAEAENVCFFGDDMNCIPQKSDIEYANQETAAYLRSNYNV